MKLKTFLAAAMVCATPFAAFGQAQYKAEDVVGHFKTEPAAAAQPACPEGVPCLRKKGTRAVCIGTDSACAQQTAATPTKPKSAFDLLITFELGSDRLSQQAELNLQEFARAMSDPALSALTFNVDGHTDASGSDDFNKVLSSRRANAVVEYLKQLGISEERLRSQGHGESKPRSDDPFAAINRRVEATIRTQ